MIQINTYKRPLQAGAVAHKGIILIDDTQDRIDGIWSLTR